MPSSRRNFIRQAGSLLPALSLSGLAGAGQVTDEKKLNIVCVGGHPDDPESGCGGTLAKLAKAGHTVTIVYLTRGEAGIEGKSHDESASIRSREAGEACKIIGAKAVFAGQVDGDSIVNNEWVGKLKAILDGLSPAIVFTHWPIDSHKDHQAASLLTQQAWIRGGKKFDLYFFEVCQGAQTRIFHPTDYVDITDVQEQKRKAVYCHVSQNPSGIYEADDCNHKMMENFRGIEIGTRAAEGFVKCGDLKM